MRLVWLLASHDGDFAVVKRVPDAESPIVPRAHRSNYNSTKVCFGYFRFCSEADPDNKKASLDVDSNCYRGVGHRMGMMWILLASGKEIPDARRHLTAFGQLLQARRI